MVAFGWGAWVLERRGALVAARNPGGGMVVRQ